MAKEKKEPTIFIEVFDKKDSGFIRDETGGTKYEVRLNCPSILNIPNVSFRKRVDGVSNERIRYILGEDEISMEVQKKLGIEPSPIANTDKIVIQEGSLTVVREGSNIGLFDFLNDCFWNASNPKRSPKATKLFRVVDLEKIAEEKNEKAIMQNEAKAWVYQLQTKKGSVWVYQEERINALCELFQVYAELPSSKVEALAGIASLYPEDFMNKVIKFEQTISTIVAHALQLNVIKFEGNTALYIDRNKIIKNLGAGNLKQDAKIEELAMYLRTKDGYEAMNELKAEVDFAKEKKADS